ncbi:dynein axonemal intermediate chain 3-like [Schistocerca cancellata]|uniref:dynein axonemal intermediate chain 3-like n=1 Tax=Schistocerca cancellata TaxID=274614 RepID=UPI0021186422|nr:dynein axonemal intermediate chain 3-like [Schistocerca cancellata]
MPKKGKGKKDVTEDGKGESTEKKKHVSLKSETEMEMEEDEEEGPPMAIEGIVRLCLPLEIQTVLECVIGEQCTLDSPWVEVRKAAIQENIGTLKAESPFYDSRIAITTYPGDRMFIGWDVLEEAENQFLLCLTKEAREEILEVLEQKRIAVEERLGNAVLKSIKEWKSLGTETFLEEAAIRDTRPKLKTKMLTERDIDKSQAPADFEDEGGDGEDDFSFRFFPKEHLKSQRIERKRYDNFCQASPPVTNREAQTYTAIPRHTWSQYEYTVDVGAGTLQEEVVEKLEGYLSSVMDNVESQLTYNAVLDLYCDDYGRIGVGAQDYEVREKVVFDEYENFIDVQHCKERVVTSVAWHPTLTGTVAVSYAEHTRFTFYERFASKGLEQMNREVKNRFYGNNLVLLWSFTDKFTPKLRLESPHEVHSLAFCPTDGDLLVGGLACGQIVVWDLAGRLERVEQREQLTEKQQAHRTAMMAHLAFMRPLAPAHIVTPAFVSSIEFSQDSSISHIQWICPRWTVSNRGKLASAAEDASPSLALLTGCEDGTVALWDLEARQPTVETALVQPKGLCELPEGEGAEPRQQLGMGTATGAVLRLAWDGIETRSGAPVDSQAGTYLWHATLHDGPVSCIARNPFCNEVLASAGGHVWALWSDTYEPGGQPLLWRCNTAPVSWCAWSVHRPSLLLVALADGSLQAWHLRDSTSAPALAQSISGRVLNTVCPHHLPLARDVVAVADYNGSLRVFILPPGFASDVSHGNVEKERLKLREFVTVSTPQF